MQPQQVANGGQTDGGTLGTRWPWGVHGHSPTHLRFFRLTRVPVAFALAIAVAAAERATHVLVVNFETF